MPHFTTRSAGALLAAALCLHGCAAVLGAGVRGDERPANDEIAAIQAAPEFQQAHWGLLVVDRASGKTLLAQNADKLFAPASTTKLYSVASALDALGADYRFHTPIYARGDIHEGRLDGDLILVAQGDLTLGGRTDALGRIAFTDRDHTYANGSRRAILTKTDPLAGIDALARQIIASGIRHVDGDVLIDDRLFDRATSTGSGPQSVTPIQINDNLIDFVITPTQPGAAARVTWRPQTSLYRIDAHVVTATKGQRTDIQISSHGPHQLVVRGSIEEGSPPQVRVREVDEPASFARALLIESLRRSGVTVLCSTLSGNRRHRLPLGDAYQSMPKVAEYTSPPFSEEVKLVLKVSHNLHASSLPLLAAVVDGRGRTLRDGLRRQRDFLSRAGVDVDFISFGGGAGGSRADYTTPRATVQLLRYMATRPDFAVYYGALPVLGVDGTLADVVSADSPTRGMVHAKTGTLVWFNLMNGTYLLTSKALAGYMTASSGRELAFAIFVNNVHLRTTSETAKVGATLGRLCEIIHASW